MENTASKIIVSEENYESEMKNTVEKYLAERGNPGYFTSYDGKNIHFEQYLNLRARATVVIAHGFTESAEKFREMSYYFLNMGYNVFAIDHRGHGYSARETDDVNAVHIRDFNVYADDLDCFINKVVRPLSGQLPLYIYSHSMGGAITVQYLQFHPGVFSKAVLSAPMISANTAGVPHAAALAMSTAAIFLGKGHERVIGSSAFNPERTYEQSHDTSKERFDYYQAKRRADTHYQTASPTYYWTREAVNVTARNLSKKRNAAIKIPVLLLQAETDAAVICPAQNKFISQLYDGRLIKIPSSRHEIYMTENNILAGYLDTIEDFLNEE